MRKILFLVLGLGSSVLQAQDYPYDETELNEDTKTTLPRESRDSVEAAKEKKQGHPPLFRFAIKGGGNWSVFREPVDATISATGFANTFGFGPEGLISLGWDLPYQPIFFEVESGYRGMFLNTDFPLHAIPFSVGMFYRNRIGPRSLFRLGLKGSCDIRITNDDFHQTDAGVGFSLGLAMALEMGPLLLEPVISVYDFHPDNLFLSVSFRTGLRF